jgi:phage/plasmid primase-like uncharacterized protein
MPAKTLTNKLGGQWMGGSGEAACPVCQPEKRRDQHSLSITWKGGKLLLNCKKGGCKFVDILRAAEFDIAPPGPHRADPSSKVELGRKRIAASLLAGEIMGASKPTLHPYLASKGFPTLKLQTIQYSDLRYIMNIPKALQGSGPGDDFLCIPLTTPTGHMSSIQLIAANGSKCFLPGGRIAGSGWFPCESGARPLILVEGAATLLSVLRTSKRIGSPVSAVACMSAGGIANMSRILMGDAVMADNDKSGTGARAARETGLLWKMPTRVGEDFNDCEQRSATEAAELLQSLTLGLSWTVEQRASPPARAKALSRDP